MILVIWRFCCCRPRLSLYCWLVNFDQHITEQSAPQQQFIQVTALHHPLRGQVFPLVRTFIKRRENYVIIRLPSGATQQLLEGWTDLCPVQPSPQVVPLFSVSSIRSLLDILKQLQDRPNHSEASNE